MKKEIDLELLKKKLGNFINNQISKSERKSFSITTRNFGDKKKRLRLLRNGKRGAMEWGEFCEQIKYSYGIHPDNINF
jgi:hypothetical protein